jgi:hypothetical protein
VHTVIHVGARDFWRKSAESNDVNTQGVASDPPTRR